MAALKELLARIRAQASEQGDDWVRQQLAAQPAPTARQAASRRRTRPPERLSPAVSSRSSQRRRMRSPSPPVAGPGSSVGASAADRRGTGKKQQGGRMPCRGQGAGRRSRAGMRLGAGSQDGADRSPVGGGGATAGSSPGRSRRESAARRGSSSSRGETTQAGQRQTDRRSTDRESERRQREPAAQRGGHGGRAATSGTDLAGEPGGSSRVSMAAPPAGGDRDGGGFSRCLSPQGAAQRSGGPQQGREGSTSRHREEDRGAASSATGCAVGRGGPPPANMGAPSVGGCWAGGVSSLLLPLQGSSGQDWSSGLGTAGGAPGTSDGSSGHRATATTDSIMEALRTAPASGPSALQLCVFRPTKLSPTAIPPTPYKNLLLDPYIMVTAVGLCIANFTFGMLEPTIPIRMMEIMCAPRYQLGLAFLPSVITYFIGLNVFGGLAQKIGRWLCIMLGLIILGISTLFMPLAVNIYGLIGPTAALGFGFGLMETSVMPLMAQLVDLRHTSDYGGIYAIADIALCIGYALGPSCGGAIAKTLGFTWLAIILGILNIAYAPLLFLLRNPPGKEETMPVLSQEEKQEEEDL